MDKELLDKLYSLKNSIEDDPRVKNLNRLNDLLNENEDVIRLAYKMDTKSVAYEDAIKHFGEHSREAIAAQKELYIAKKELDSHPLVKEYNQAYKEVRLMYEEINKTLFKPFKSKIGSCEVNDD